jgi:hypothetical protein
MGDSPDFDVTVPNVARMCDYYLGGKDHFEADRIAAEKVLALVPVPAPASRNVPKRAIGYAIAAPNAQSGTR